MPPKSSSSFRIKLFLALILVLGAGACASGPQYRYRPHLTAPGADVLAALTLASGNEGVGGNRVQLLINGDQTFPSMLEAIRNAKTSIHIEAYIFRDGEIGRQFTEALAERARAGVGVRLLLDAIGSARFGQRNEKLLADAGAQVVFFRPLKISTLRKIHLRTHRKVLIVDGKIGFTGGICIEDSWRGNGDRPDVWRDTNVRVEGPVVRQMQTAFARAWLEATNELLNAKMLYPEEPVVGSLTCQVMDSTPGFDSNPARLSFLVGVASARRSVEITNAYFVPDRAAREALLKAAKAGIKIRILLPSRKTDVKAVRFAGRSYYHQLLEAGVRIFEYEPSMLHAKTMIIDGQWATLGSANLDRRSFAWSYESNLNVFDEGFARQMQDLFEADLAKSNEVTLEAWKKRPFGEKCLEWLYGIFRWQY